MECSPTTVDTSVYSDHPAHKRPLDAYRGTGLPDPDLVGFFEHKRPPFIEFERDGSGSLWIRSHQGRAEKGKLSYFFDPVGYGGARGPKRAD